MIKPIPKWLNVSIVGRLLSYGLATCLAIFGRVAAIQAQTSLSVADYGAQGDAVQFWVNTTSNSVVVTATNQLSSADIGKAIEVFGAGTVTTPPNCQDMVATITNIINGTNIYVSQIAQATLTGTFATYGHNNQTNFQAAIAACGGATNAIINIPAGKYLFLCPHNPAIYANSALILAGGGVHFVGAGANNTTLLSQGAWILQNGAAERGFLFAIVPPVTNDFPISFEKMTMDGGVQQGNTSNHGFPASVVDGTGWDETHDAIDVRGFSGNQFTHDTWANVVFAHWRGEMVKSNDGSTNGNLNILNCVFNDGNATAINIYPSLNISNCVFENLFQVAEYYQAYGTNTCYFQQNVVTNITGNAFALNGGKGNNPPFIIQGNIFYFSADGYNGIETVPADNVLVLSNQFICQNNIHCACIDLGSAGYQGNYDNSNIVVAYNSFINPARVLEIDGGVSSTDPQRVESVSVYSNSVTTTANFTATPIGLVTYNWATNVHFFGNDFSNVTNGVVNFSSGAYGGQYALVDINNIYYSTIYDLTGQTNYISYAKGPRIHVIYRVRTGTVYALQDSDASQIPLGAQMVISNATSNPPGSFPLYLNSGLTSGPLTVTNGASFTFQWTNGAWQLAASPPLPPTGLHVIQQ